jgi:ABC-type uncharacterized transport system permease subunit
MLVIIAFAVGAIAGFITGMLCFRNNQDKFNDIDKAIK